MKFYTLKKMKKVNFKSFEKNLYTNNQHPDLL